MSHFSSKEQLGDVSLLRDVMPLAAKKIETVTDLCDHNQELSAAVNIGVEKA